MYKSHLNCLVIKFFHRFLSTIFYLKVKQESKTNRHPFPNDHLLLFLEEIMQTSIGQSVLKGLKTDRKEFLLLSQQTGFLRFAFNWPLVINSLCFQTGRSFCKPSFGCPGSEWTSFWLFGCEKTKNVCSQTRFAFNEFSLKTSSGWK